MGEKPKAQENLQLKVDPEAIIELIRSQGLSAKKACEKVGLTYGLFTQWKARDRFNLKARIQDARETYAKRLALQTVEIFPEKAKPRHMVMFLERFAATGEQIMACRYAGMSYQQMKDYCNPSSLHFNWWFAESFQALLNEQQQEIRDRMITQSKNNPSLLTQIIRDFEKVQAPPGKDADEEKSVSDDQILEALNKIADKIHEPADLPSTEPRPVQASPS